jgi:predicted O-methyltransferase YrrM
MIAYLAKLLEPNIYVELGIEVASTINAVAKHAKRCLGVDINPACRASITEPNIEFFCETTEVFINNYKDVNINMVFIDADHNCDAVISDFRGIYPYVVDQGIILLHDTYPGSKAYTTPFFCNNAYQAVDILRTEYKDCEFTTIPVHPGLTICRKRIDDYSWLK